MIETKELQTSSTNWTVLQQQATTLLKSGFLPASVRTPEQVIAITLTGRELGIGMMEALRGINVIQGKPSVSPQLMLALANRTGQLEDIKIQANEVEAVVQIKRKGREWHVEHFGPTQASALGLMDKDNYKKQASTMFKWRALAAALRVTFPDAISGLYTPEEMGAEVMVNEQEEMTVVDTGTREVKENGLRDDAWDSPNNQGDPNTQESWKDKVFPGKPEDLYAKLNDPQMLANIATETHQNAQEGPQNDPSEPKVEVHDRGFYLRKSLEYAMALAPQHSAKAGEALILDIAKFESKKEPGKIIVPKWESFAKNDVWVKIVYHKVKERYEAFMKNEDQPGDAQE